MKKEDLFSEPENRESLKIPENYVDAMKIAGYDLTRVDDFCFFKNRATSHEIGLDFEAGIYDYLHEINLKSYERDRVEEILPTAEYEIKNPFFSNGHIQFTLELHENGKTSFLDGIYRIHDTSNGPDNKLVTINSDSFEQDMGVLYREWNRIEARLKEIGIEKGYIERKPETDMRMDDEYEDIKYIKAAQLPEGWEWECHNDGSGALQSPDGKKYFTYDMQTNEFNYMDQREWSILDKSLPEYQKYAENIMADELEKMQFKTDLQYINEANQKLAAKDAGRMRDYATNEIHESLSEVEARKALDLGIKLDIISEYQDYHGSHEGHYDKSRLKATDIDEFYADQKGRFRGRYKSYRTWPYISTDYEMADVDTKKLKDVIQRQVEQRKEIVSDVERSGFRPTKSLIENIERFNLKSQEKHSLKDLAEIKRKNPNFKDDSKKMECLKNIISECQTQEIQKSEKLFLKTEMKMEASNLPAAGM